MPTGRKSGLGWGYKRWQLRESQRYEILLEGMKETRHEGAENNLRKNIGLMSRRQRSVGARGSLCNINNHLSR